ncbi:MAG: S9 family peptidase [Gemmatimonadota bacterium]|nr:MAG: S9 family peptidase [Gemmatimonadota bacterium]
MRNIRCTVCLSTIALLIPIGLTAQRQLAPLDAITMKSVSGVYPSPDGTKIAFTRSEPRAPDDAPGSAYTTLYMLDESGNEYPLAAGKRYIGGVAWKPDGSAITFLEQREGDNGRQLYALPVGGGEATRVFVADRGIQQYRWSRRGEAVAFTAQDAAPEARAAARELGFRQRVVDEDWNAIELHIWTADDGQTSGVDVPGSVFDLEWSPDASRLALAVAPRPLIDDRYMFKRIHLLDVNTGRVGQLVDNPGKLGQLSWSPDSRSLAYISAADPRDPHAGTLYVADTETGAVTGLTEDFKGMVHAVQWREPNRLRLRISRGVASRVSDFDMNDRSFNDLAASDMAFGSVHSAGATVAAVVSGPTHPAEVYTLEGGSWVRRTNSNEWLDEVRLSRQEVYSIEARDGLEIEGVLLYPLDMREDQRYPLVIVVHGGPESHYNNGWMTTYSGWGQLLSSKGYFVWYPNYRSSTGRGVEFAKADHGDLMGSEFEDHLDAIDHFVAKGWVDRERVGLGGGSYGGYAAAWAATRHTEHFAAAVSSVPITHVATKWLTTDIYWEYYYVHYEETWPHDQWDYLEERSPLTYASQCRTPLLLLGGTSDTRVHPSQPHMLYRAVKTSTETPVRYIQYPGEGHGNRTNVYRYDFALRALRWFDHYLKPGDHRGDPPPLVDVEYEGWGGR